MTVEGGHGHDARPLGVAQVHDGAGGAGGAPRRSTAAGGGGHDAQAR